MKSSQRIVFYFLFVVFFHWGSACFGVCAGRNGVKNNCPEYIFGAAWEDCSEEQIERVGKMILQKFCAFYSVHPTDMKEYVPVLRRIAQECSTVVELGTGFDFVSTWGILTGLAESSAEKKTYLGVDIREPEEGSLRIAKFLSETQKISYSFLLADDLRISCEEIPETDLLFIDTNHIYAHLFYELETFSPRALRYIALLDTSGPFAFSDAVYYRGDRSEYPFFVSREKRGTWNAVQDFLERHPEWRLIERYCEGYGFTLLKRER